jgi:hypothetical protein
VFEVEELLHKHNVTHAVWPYEAVSVCFAWMEQFFKRGPELVRSPLRLRLGVPKPLVLTVLHRFPSLLLRTPEHLARKWEALQAPRSAGGVGLSHKQACRVLAFLPCSLAYATQRFLDRVALLERLGVEDAAGCLAAFPGQIGLREEAVQSKLAVLRHYGLQPGVTLARFPALQGVRDELLEQKLRFYLGALSMPTDAIGERAPILLGLGLDARVRPRCAVLASLGPLPGCIATLLKLTDELFVRRGLQLHGVPAPLSTLEGYRQHIASPELLAFAAEWEAERMAEAERAGRLPPPMQDMPLAPLDPWAHAL